jgi:hypothetical protein
MGGERGKHCQGREGSNGGGKRLGMTVEKREGMTGGKGEAMPGYREGNGRGKRLGMTMDKIKRMGR